MFKYKSVKEQMLETKRKNEALKSGLLKIQADMDYLAMMTDIELETEDENEQI